MMTISLYFIMLDSGGALGLRNVGFLFIFLLFLKSILFYEKKPTFFFQISVISLLVALYCFAVSFFNDIEPEFIIDKIVVFFSIPVFLFAMSTLDSNVIKKVLIYSGLIFSLTMFLTFFLLWLMPVEVSLFFSELKIPGWFYLREDGYPQVYYQTTLSLVPIAIFAYLENYKKASYVMQLALLLCLSRFGFFVVILFILFRRFFAERVLSRAVIILFVFIAFLFPLFCFIIYSNVDEGQLRYSWLYGDSLGIRLGHLYSIFNDFNIINFLFGSGAGSSFYSLGFHDYTDNIEVSQLEILRRYGIIGYIFINIVFFVIFLKLYNHEKNVSNICLFSFYLVAFSNPVLLTLSLSIFMGSFLNDKKPTESWIN